jgi:hypothetical protein
MKNIIVAIQTNAVKKVNNNPITSKIIAIRKISVIGEFLENIFLRLKQSVTYFDVFIMGRIPFNI